MPPNRDPNRAEQFGQAAYIGQQFASLAGIGARGYFQLQAVAELGTMLGRVNPLLLGSVGALTALTAAAIGAAQRLNQIGAGMAQTGGTAGQIGALGGIFGALGLDQAGVAGVARQLREQVAAGGLGTAAGAALGLRPQPIGVGTPPNEARMLLDAIGALRRMSDSQARLTAERLPALAPFLSLRFASEEQMIRIRQMAEQMDRLATPEALGRAMEFNLQMQQLRMTFDQLVVRLGGSFLPVLNVILAHANMLAGQVAALGGRGETPMEANTRALDANTQQIEVMNKGIYGGGRRARRAIPGGIGDALDARFRQEAAVLGAF